MSVRAFAIGSSLALAITLFAYFNDWVIGQTQLIGNHLPISVLGVAVLLVLAVGPALSFVRPRWGFTAAEVAMITALGLLGCGWSGSNFFRIFTHAVVMPAHWVKTKASWQSQNVMSYVPGGSAELGQGHVLDWNALGRRLVGAGATGAHDAPGQLWSMLTPVAQRSFSAGVATDFDPSRVAELTSALNVALNRSELYDPAAFRGRGITSLVLRARRADVVLRLTARDREPRGEGVQLDALRQLSRRRLDDRVHRAQLLRERPQERAWWQTRPRHSGLRALGWSRVCGGRRCRGADRPFGWAVALVVRRVHRARASGVPDAGGLRNRRFLRANGLVTRRCHQRADRLSGARPDRIHRARFGERRAVHRSARALHAVHQQRVEAGRPRRRPDAHARRAVVRDRDPRQHGAHRGRDALPSIQSQLGAGR